MRRIRSGAEALDPDIRLAVGDAFGHYSRHTGLATLAAELIRAGRPGGLSFDSLTTDLFLGCLPATQICYGSCFAARAAFDAGVDFARRVPNVLDEVTFTDDLERLPGDQKYLRNGWNSDPSWDWSQAAR